MKWLSFLIFFAIVLLIHSLVNFYIYRKLSIVLPPQTIIRTIGMTVFWISTLSYFSGRILEKIHLSVFSDILIWIGAIWFAFMLYFFLSFLLLDFLRLLDYLFGVFPSVITKNISRIYHLVGLLIIVGISLTVLLGFINSRIITVKHLDINIKKSAGNLSELKVTMFSDLHLGSMIGKKFAQKVVYKVNEQQPDIILIPGDIIDEDIEPVLRDGICEELQKLKSKYGVFAITGNHEYIGDAEKAVEYLSKNGINVLRDSSLLINNSFYLLGREDRSKRQFTGEYRKPLSDLMKDIDANLPIILMDHQPFKLEEADKAGVDLQLSGHTHHGQLWPINYITEKIYELSWGYKQKNSTHYYVSCGLGGWGPPVRLGSRPEIVNINLVFGE